MKIPNIAEIITAWHHAKNPTSEQKELAEYRGSICETCEFKQFKQLIRTHICGVCGCPISKKIYSPLPGPKACPKGKWEK